MEDTKFMSAKEKEKVFRDWLRFIESDFSAEQFTRALYNHLIQHCSFIAHFNQAGFYETYFEDPGDKLRFMKQFDRGQGCNSIEYGMKYWLNNEIYGDINVVMVESLEPHKARIYPKLRQKAREIKLGDIESLRREIEELE